MPVISGGGGGGNTTAQVTASGKVLPVADATGVTVDTTTYDDVIKGGGAKLTTLIFPADQGALAVAISGDAFPRWVFGADPSSFGFTFGDGTTDAASNASIAFDNSGGPGVFSGIATAGVRVSQGRFANEAARFDQISPRYSITSGALPTVQLVTATGVQISVSRDTETVTPFTGDGTNNAATCAIAISPDNATYSTVATISIAAALNLTGVLTDTVNARVPAGWYLRLTVSHGTLGLTTWY